MTASILGPLKFAAKAAFRAPGRFSEWLLQPSRYRRSLAAAGRGVPESVLFVCHGNICRSPYAEHAARRLLPADLQGRVRIESAGFFGPHRPSPPEALESARLRGVDLSPHRSRLMTNEMVAATDLVFVMEEEHRRRLLASFGRPRGEVLILGESDPVRREPRTIADPYGKSLPEFIQTYGRIDRCLEQVVGAIEAAARNGSP